MTPSAVFGVGREGFSRLTIGDRPHNRPSTDNRRPDRRTSACPADDDAGAARRLSA